MNSICRDIVVHDKTHNSQTEIEKPFSHVTSCYNLFLQLNGNICILACIYIEFL